MGVDHYAPAKKIIDEYVPYHAVKLRATLVGFLVKLLDSQSQSQVLLMILTKIK